MEEILDYEENEPKFSFWRNGMSIWYQNMKHHHEITNEVYMAFLTRLRTQHLLSKMEELMEEIPSTAM